MEHKIKHHLSDQLLMGYSAGTLPEAFNLVVATHISMCDECRARLDSFDAVGGCLIDEEQVETASDAWLAAVMADLDDIPVEAAPVAPSKPSVFPAPLRDYAGGDLDDVSWRRVGGGVRQKILKTSSDATVRLLRIPGGVAMPDHSHGGLELTMVLQGAFRDEDGRYGPGDIEIANEHTHHTPVAEEGEDCICIAATDAPLQFKSWMPRLAQNFLRI